MIKKKKFALTHARFDAVHCLTPGLFRALKKGDRKRLKLHAVYEHKDLRVEFKGPEPLGADDLRVLQGLVALGRLTGRRLPPEPETEKGKQLRLALEPQWDGVYEEAITVRSSYRRLAREIGYANFEDTKRIRDCIKRLWAVSIIVRKGAREMGFRLLSAYAGNLETGRLYVALNPLIARAIMGKQYRNVDMNEVRELKTDAAVIIHHRLCGWIDPGKSGRVTIDTLCEYAWPDKARGSTSRMRRQRVRQALAELKRLKWGVKEYAENKFEIRRPQNQLATPPC